MISRSFLGLLGSLACWLVGCDRTPVAEPPAPVLRFPVLLVWPGQSVMIRSEEDDLKSMHINYLTGERPQPVLLDSDLKIYDMLNLKTTKSGIGLMLNPSGSVPIEFKLQPHLTNGLDTARTLVSGCKWLGGDPDEAEAKRTKLNQATTVAAMIEILQGESPS